MIKLNSNCMMCKLGNLIKEYLKYNRIMFAFLFYMFYADINAQFLDDEVCISGTRMEIDYRKKPWKGNNKFLMNYLEKVNYFENKGKVRFLVPVKFWVYHDNKGQGGSSISDIKEFITDLNKFNELNQTGIQFYIRETKHINNSSRQIFGYYLEATLQTIFRHTKFAVNVFLIDAFKKKQESRKVVRGTYNMVTKSIILQRKNSSTGLTHEVGHYFGLLHPHRHYDKGISKQEPVSRTRTKNENGKGILFCEERGDLLSDTKAEPKLTHLVDNDCNFTGTALKDAWGDNYQSDVNNIMSYPTHSVCRDTFTLSQKGVMLYSAEANKYGKYWSTDKEVNHKYFFDKTEPNEYMEIAGAIPTGEKQQFNFHKIFLSKRKDKNDTCDWIKFEVKQEDKRNVRIIIVPDVTNTNPITAVFYDKNQMALSKVKTAKAGEQIELGFTGLVSDWYYIHISTNETESKHVDKYSVDVELFD